MTATPLRRDRVALRRRALAGATFLYFGLIGLPALFFSTAMAVDFTRIIIAAREMHDAAQAAALAGAYQFQDASTGDPTQIDTSAARRATQQTLCEAVRYGETHLTSYTCTDALRVVPKFNADRTVVTVDVDYKVNGLVFVGLVQSLTGGHGMQSVQGRHVTAKAFVCNPTITSGPTQGYCVRPQRWKLPAAPGG